MAAKMPAGARSKIVKAIGNVIHLSDGKRINVKAFGRNVAKADHVPSFKVGSKPTLAGKSAEYARQLQRQIDGLNSMSAKDLLKNLDEVKRGGLAQKQAREKFRKGLERDAYQELRKRGVPPKAAREQAAQVADSRMSTLAALHEPDIVAGGRDVIGVGPDGLPSMGDTYVNSSIGSQWRARQAELRAYAESLVASGRGGSPLNISFLLE